jgi:hypothetical protein
MRGATFCVAHRDDPEIPAEETDGKPDLHEQFAEQLRAGQHAELIDLTVQAALDVFATDHSLATEIGALRLMVRRVIVTELLDGDLRETSLTLTRLVDALIRALRMEQTLATRLEDELRAVVTRFFAGQGRLEDA